MIITPKGWKEFQHYKDRRPPWIKLYRTLLDDVEFHALPDASKALAIMLWLLASERTDASINADSKALAFRLRTTPAKITDSLKPLMESGFFLCLQDDSSLLAGCLQDAIPEKRREEIEADGSFSLFWEVWPKSERKGGKSQCFEKWKKLKLNGQAEAVIAHVEKMKASRQWSDDNGAYIPAPISYLNKRSWDGAEQQEARERKVALP